MLRHTNHELNDLLIYFYRAIREFEAQLDYERIRREKLESESDKLRAKIHSLNLELEEMRNKPFTLVNIFQQFN